MIKEALITPAIVAGAYAQSVVRPATPHVVDRSSKPRFESEIAVSERKGSERKEAPVQGKAEETGAPSRFSGLWQKITGKGESGGAGSGLLGAFTSFLSSVLGQQDDGVKIASISKAALQSGVAAYTRLTQSGTAALEIDTGAGFGPLASGHVLDLSV